MECRVHGALGTLLTTGHDILKLMQLRADYKARSVTAGDGVLQRKRVKANERAEVRATVAGEDNVMVIVGTQVFT